MTWKIEVKDPHAVLGEIFTAIPDLKVRSAPALQELYIQTVSALIDIVRLSIQILQERMSKLKEDDAQAHMIKENVVERGKLSRFIRSLRRQTQYLPNDRDRLLQKIYDTILESEDMGLLRGFGMGNRFGDFIGGNPERQSVCPPEVKRTKTLISSNKEVTTMATTINRKDLQKVAKELNDLMGLDPAIDLDADDDELKDKIIEAHKELTEDDELTKLADKVFAILIPPKGKGKVEDEEEEESAPAPKKTAPAKAKAKVPEKAPAKAKVPEKKGASAKAKPSAEKDEFGFVVGTKKSLFANAIKEKPMTMSQVQKLKWNENGATYNGTFAELKRAGKAYKEDGIMYIGKPKAKAAVAKGGK